MISVKEKTELPVDIHIYKDNAKTFTRKVDVKLTTSLYAGIFLTALNGCGLWYLLLGYYKALFYALLYYYNKLQFLSLPIYDWWLYWFC